MNEHQMTQRLSCQREPQPPHSDPPDLEHLAIRVRNRRRARKIMAGSAWTATMVMLMACVFVWKNTHQPQADQVSRAVVRADTASPAQPREPARPKVNKPVPESPAPVKVFAKVHQPIPVFDRQEGTDYIRHVGWIDSQQIIPVDLSRFPLEQQKSMEAALHEDQSSPYFSL